MLSLIAAMLVLAMRRLCRWDIDKHYAAGGDFSRCSSMRFGSATMHIMIFRRRKRVSYHSPFSAAARAGYLFAHATPKGRLSRVKDVSRRHSKSRYRFMRCYYADYVKRRLIGDYYVGP